MSSSEAHSFACSRLESRSNLLLRVGFGCALILMTSLACASRNRGADEPTIGVSSHIELVEQEEREKSDTKTIDPEAVQKAVRPFTGYRSADERSFSQESFLTHLAAADAICLAERADSPTDHAAGLAFIEALAERRPMRGFEFAVGFANVLSRDQAALDAYFEGRLQEESLSTRLSGGHEGLAPLAYTLPQLRATLSENILPLAWGAEPALLTSIRAEGLARLNTHFTRLLPPLDLDQKKHFELFQARHPDLEGSELENHYAARVVSEELLAEPGSNYLKARAPGRKLLILASPEQCHRSAVSERLARRGSFTVVNVLPVEDQPVRVNASSEEPQDLLIGGYDYQLVTSTPAE